MYNIKKFVFVFLIFNVLDSFCQSPQWQGITKLIDYNPTRLSTDSSTNSLLISNGPIQIENKNYYGCATWNNNLFDSLAPFSSNYNILQIIKYKGDFYANTPLKILKKISPYNWSEIATVKNSATAGMCIFNNNLIVYGGFDSINNIEASHMAKYDGVSWSKMDTMHFKKGTHILTAEEFNGNLYFGGTVIAKNGWCFNLGMYNGTSFLNVNNNIMSGSNSAVTKIKKYKNALYMIGNFNTYKGNPGNNVIKWDGAQWDSLGGGISTGPNIIYDFTEHKNELYFVGMFYAVAGMASPGFIKFDGNKFWGHNITCTDYQTLKCLHSYNDTLFVSGYFNKLCNDSVRFIAKWLENPSIFTNSVSVISVRELQLNSIIIKLFPNPNSGSFTLQTKEDVVLEIVNELGQIVKTIKLDSSNNHQTTISGLADGVYCLKDKLSGAVIKNKIVVVR